MNLKLKLNENQINKLSIILLIISSCITLFALYCLFKLSYPSLYVILFSFSLFFSLGIIANLTVSKLQNEESKPSFELKRNFIYRILQIAYFILIVNLLLILNNSLYIKDFIIIFF